MRYPNILLVAVVLFSSHVAIARGLKPTTRHALYKAVEIHLSKPYKRMRPRDHQLRDRGKVVERKNHGALHALRVASYIKPIAYAIRKNGNLALAKALSNKGFEKMIAQLEVAAAFNVSGREGEENASFPIYKTYRKDSAKYFSRYVKNNKQAARLFGNKTATIDAFSQDVIENRGKPQKARNSYLALCSQILGIAHDLDLSRCKGAKTMQAIERKIAKTIPSGDARRLIIHAQNTIPATGQGLTVKGIGYNIPLFVKLSFNLPGYKRHEKNFNAYKASDAEKVVVKKRPRF